MRHIGAISTAIIARKNLFKILTTFTDLVNARLAEARMAFCTAMIEVRYNSSTMSEYDNAEVLLVHGDIDLPRDECIAQAETFSFFFNLRDCIVPYFYYPLCKLFFREMLSYSFL